MPPYASAHDGFFMPDLRSRGGGWPGESPELSEPKPGRQSLEPADATQRVSDGKVTLEELYKGKTVKFAAEKKVICGQCNGSGAKDKVKPEEKDRCKKCKGKRTVTESKALELYIPRGSMQGERITLEGEADQMPDQAPRPGRGARAVEAVAKLGCVARSLSAGQAPGVEPAPGHQPRLDLRRRGGSHGSAADRRGDKSRRPLTVSFSSRPRAGAMPRVPLDGGDSWRAFETTMISPVDSGRPFLAVGDWRGTGSSIGGDNGSSSHARRLSATASTVGSSTASSGGGFSSSERPLSREGSVSVPDGPSRIENLCQTVRASQVDEKRQC
ncbi:hypothetical protein B0T24DRAFT_598178 [Lasiosphaeria ovina]|uniref:Chaperone DnaJ C-terminal domain-containing protein n=1 Tax=Lasiosphaeria ovina TaxID=92902 RepID=A0AAE0JUU5_9PEZI|nr:hypothetical protein B0T24DRAFT_598178 [Lasiosphaeria ovina]